VKREGLWRVLFIGLVLGMTAEQYLNQHPSAQGCIITLWDFSFEMLKTMVLSVVGVLY
jgi:hypothetical protein